MDRAFSLEDLARQIGAEVRGRGDRMISGLSELHESREDRLSFLAEAALAEKLSPEIPVVAVEKDFPQGRDGLVVKSFRGGMGALLAIFEPRYHQPEGVSPSAWVSPLAQVSDDAVIGPNCTVREGAKIGPRVRLIANVYVGPEAEIGEGTVVEPMAVIEQRCKIGARCLIHSCAVLGSDGFGIIPGGPEGVNVKIPQIGRVVLGDDVEIGACTCIDRGTIGDTLVGSGTKTDNQVQIGHNCRIGKNCIIASQTGVSGSVTLEDGVIMAARSGVQDHRRIGRGAVVAALAGVTKDVPPGKTVSGFPAVDHKAHFRLEAQLRKVPELIQRMKELEKELRR